MNTRNTHRALAFCCAALVTLTLLGSIHLLAVPAAADQGAFTLQAPADAVVVIEAQRLPRT